MKLEPLYRRNVNGAIQVWKIEVLGNAFRTKDGVVATRNGEPGKLTASKWTVCEGKNAGRTNATSPAEQAIKQAQAKWVKKCKQRFVASIERVDDAPAYFPPMLCAKYKKGMRPKGRFWYVQPKLDGIRCLIRKGDMQSREGTPIVACPHILQQLAPVFERYPHAVFDGELYNHSLHSEFEEIVSITRKTKLSKADLQRSAEVMQFHCYDFIPDIRDIEVYTFQERFMDRLNCDPCDSIFAITHCQPASFVVVPTVKVSSRKALDAHYTEMLNTQYEGQIIREPNASYKSAGRPKDILKRKPMQTAEFEITDILEGRGNRGQMAGSLQIRLKNGAVQGAGIRGGEAKYVRMLRDRDQLIGQLATVRFQNRTATGRLRFPIVVAVRDYE